MSDTQVRLCTMTGKMCPSHTLYHLEIVAVILFIIVLIAALWKVLSK